MVDFEADDALATLAKVAAADPRVEQVLICSPDKDLAQCVSGTRVVLLDRMRKKLLDESAVVEKFGVPPRAIPDYLALVGDTADGIPGIPGFGAKTASALLAAHGSLESIPGDPAGYGKTVRGAERLSKELEGRREDARLYRTLATLRTDVPLDVDLDALAWHGPDEPALAALAQELGDESLLSRAAAVATARKAPR
jgi:5'-3' exonuclease